MEFDWARAIGKNREELIGIVTTLFVMAGIRTGHVVAALPRFLRLRILGLLRPAEYAARRLILMAACTMEFRGSAPKAGISSSPLQESSGTGKEPSLPAFALFDPFKRYGHPWLEPDDVVALSGDGFEAGVWLPPDEPVDAAGLCRRIRALERALQDLEGAALRLARWRARRDRENCRPRRFSVMRPGLPPGWKHRPKTHVEEVVRECHTLALAAWNTRDPPASVSEA